MCAGGCGGVRGAAQSTRELVYLLALALRCEWNTALGFVVRVENSDECLSFVFTACISREPAG